MSSFEIIEALSGRRGSADTVVNVAAAEFGFEAIELIEKLVFNVGYGENGVAGSHFGTHCLVIDLFMITVRE